MRLDYTNPGNDGGSGGWFAPPAIDVKGTLVGWANIVNGDASGQSLGLFIRDLRRAKPQYGLAEFALTFEENVAIGSLRIVSERALAWIACNGLGGPLTSQRQCSTPKAEVDNIAEIYDARNTAESRPIFVDRGMHIDASSLRRHGNTVYWRDGSARRSTTLAP